MKKTHILFTILSGITLSCLFTLTASCKSYQKKSTEISGVTAIAIPAFSEIALSAVADIHFTQSPKYTIRVEGDPELIDATLIESKNGVLKIYTKSNNNSVKGKKKMHIYVTAPDLSKVNLSGVGSVSMDKVKFDHLELNLRGVGNISVNNLNCQTLEASMSGVGSIELSGKCQSGSLSMSGVGSIDAENLSGNITKKCSGVGKVNIKQ